MNDGRNFAGWQPGNAVNESIRRAENIKTNWDYRRFLTTNADQIMTLNKIDAVNMSGHGSFEVNAYEQENQRNVPFMYASVMDDREPFGYVQSDLKETYLSREALQARMIAPEITQEQVLEFQRQQQARGQQQ
jgi:nucleoid DNA-binding protein